MKKLEKETLIEEELPKSYRHWIILLYEDSKSYDFNEVLSIIKSQKNYAFIKHLPESDEKKAHYHVILSFENATKKSTLSKKLGVPENYINEIKAFRRMCRYLVHKDDEDKKQYELSEVNISTCFKRTYLKCFDDIEDENQIISNIYDYIKEIAVLGYFEALRELIVYVNDKVYDKIYKRYRNEFLDYLKYLCDK